MIDHWVNHSLYAHFGIVGEITGCNNIPCITMEMNGEITGMELKGSYISRLVT